MTAEHKDKKPGEIDATLLALEGNKCTRKPTLCALISGFARDID